MADIKFNCPGCRQSLEAPPDMAGQLIDCPSCKISIEIPQARALERQPPLRAYTSPGPSAALAPQHSLTKCPYCAEMIQREARICKHCKANLTGGPVTGIGMTFGGLVIQIVKVVLASITAFFILWLLGQMLYAFYTGWTYRGSSM